VLTSKFSGFGGLSGLRLDAKGERFISFSDKGTWFTGRIVYQGRQMTGLADVEAAPMLGPDGTSIASHGWYDTESIARDGDVVCQDTASLSLTRATRTPFHVEFDAADFLQRW
jgi:hypothetical protein